MNLAKILLQHCSNFEKTKLKVSLYVQCLELFSYFDDSALEDAMTLEVVQVLLRVFDICRRCDIVHTKVFNIFQKIPLKINSDKKITNMLKNFCYYCKIEKSSIQGKEMTNVSTHFLYQLMEFFEFNGDNEYDGILKTWMEELKELFGKKLLMESDLSDLEESHLRNSGLEINADFNFFGDDNRPDEFLNNQRQPDPKPSSGFFEFDFTQPPKKMKGDEQESENKGFGMSQGEFDEPQSLGSSRNKVNHLENFDFDDFGDQKKKEDIPESPIKNSSKQGRR